LSSTHSIELGLWVNPEERARLVNLVPEEGGATDFAHAVRTKSGEIRRILSSRVEVQLDGEPCLLTMASDITERHRAEEALRETENRFREVLNASSDIICRINLVDYACEYVSPAVLPMTGFTQEEFAALGIRNFRHRFHPDDWRQYKRSIGDLIAGSDQAARHHEYRWLCKDGQYRWFADSLAVIRDENGRPATLIAVVRDTTERREAEEALRESEMRFRELSACSPVGVFRTDAEGNTLYTNERLREITGLSEEENMGTGWASVVHPEDREAAMLRRSIAIAAGKEYFLEFRLKTQQRGITWVRVHSRPVFSSDGRHIGQVGTVEDITEHKAAEERERRLQQQEARTRELRAAVQALERMAATLGHELRNPLGVISNSAYFLSKYAAISDHKARKHVEIIAREVRSAQRTIDDILEFAHVPQIVTSPAHLNAVVDHALERSQIPANVRLVRRLAPDLPPLVCDAERLERAFIDIVTNAVQAMPHGGRLIVRTQHAADSVRVTFCDTGEGIAPQNLPRVFDPMFTTKLRGVGLGLTVVRRTVEQHGGQVGLTSKLGGGTSVTVTLPLAPAQLTSQDALSPVGGTPAPSSSRASA
jgi:PAS domain S-box-containing protein